MVVGLNTERSPASLRDPFLAMYPQIQMASWFAMPWIFSSGEIVSAEAAMRVTAAAAATAGAAAAIATGAAATTGAGAGGGAAFAWRRALRALMALLSSTSDMLSIVVTKEVAPATAPAGRNLPSSAREISSIYVRGERTG